MRMVKPTLNQCSTLRREYCRTPRKDRRCWTAGALEAQQDIEREFCKKLDSDNYNAFWTRYIYGRVTVCATHEDPDLDDSNQVMKGYTTDTLDLSFVRYSLPAQLLSYAGWVAQQSTSIWQ